MSCKVKIGGLYYRKTFGVVRLITHIDVENSDVKTLILYPIMFKYDKYTINNFEIEFFEKKYEEM